MAVYEYICSNCKKQFEVRRSIHESNKVTACPSCGKQAQKMVSVFSAKIPEIMDIQGEKISVSSKIYT